MKPLLVAPGDGEVITDRVARSLIVVAATQEMDVTWLRYEAGESGPAPHVHREHADCFYILDGRLRFGLGPGGQETIAEAGTFVLVPRNTVHSFHNDSPEAARFLSVHAPSCGFRDYLRALRDGRRRQAVKCDQHDLPDDGGQTAPDAIVGPGAAEVDGNSLSETALGDEQRREAGPLTGYWVLDGTLTVGLPDESLVAGVGGFVLVPADTEHTVAGPARAVVIEA